MSNSSVNSFIRLRGVRHNNLKNFDLDLPTGQLIVVTGPSGSGKSSLAFDTLYAEGQRRYIETFSPYARQFFDRMDKPQVDSIQGIPPAIAIEQRNTVRSTRSTVGTMTEICDYVKLVWSHLSQLYCRQCGQPVRKDSPQQIWESLQGRSPISGSGGTGYQPVPSGNLPDGTGVTSMNNPGAGLPATSTPLPVGKLPTGAGGLPASPISQTGSQSSSVATGGGGRHAVDRPVSPTGGKDVVITFQLPLSSKLSLDESLSLVAKQGYQRLLIEPSAAGPEPLRSEPEILRLEETAPRWQSHPPESLTIVQDRLRFDSTQRARFVEACEQAYHFGKGKLILHFLDGTPARKFSNRFHCAECDLEYREPTPALFSFNHPLGACPTCRGFGRTITIDYDLALPDRSLSLADGAVKPWQSGQSAECQDDLLKFCRRRRVPTDVPFEKLSPKWQTWVLDGDTDYGKDEKHKWPHAWYGVKGYFRWLESKAYKMHVRVLLSRYRAYRTCPNCGGRRFQSEALLFQVPTANATLISLADFYRLPVREALCFVDDLMARQGSHRNLSGESPMGSTGYQPVPSGNLPDGKGGASRNHPGVGIVATPAAIPVGRLPTGVGRLPAPPIAQKGPTASDPLTLALQEVRSRLGYLDEVGLGYVTLDRATRTLSGGETERVNLTTCLGSRLVNTLFVLDEPSVGLHARDTARLVRILHRLRAAGNTVVVVEHEARVIQAADQVVDLGPGHGETGGHLVFQGTFREILHASESLTGQYLSAQKRIETPPRRSVNSKVKSLKLHHARHHNLKDLTVGIPLGRFVCVTGVSGSGKTTLVRDVLLPNLEAKLKNRDKKNGSPKSKVQSPKSGDDADDSMSPTAASELVNSKLAGADHLGRVVLVDQSPLGKTPRSNPAVYIGAFDHIRECFAQSELARQRGLNASAFSFNSAQGQCERCRGAGFEKIEMQFLSDVFVRCPDCHGRRYRPHILEVKLITWSIADLLDATVEEAIRFLSSFPDSRAAGRAVQSLKLLEEVGLGYLRLGQPINTLSGGESQRLKLVSHLAEFAAAEAQEQKPTLFLFDEPTTGLHFDDVRVLLKVFQRLVDRGHSVVVIEHNLDVIKCADWLIDLGPEAGEQGGRIVVEGPPEDVAACSESHTGQALREMGLHR